jgi:hypothetical protein
MVADWFLRWPGQTNYPEIEEFGCDFGIRLKAI